MNKNRTKVVGKDSDGNEVTVYVTRPTKEDNSDAQIVASKVFKKAVMEGALLKQSLDNILREQGLWDDNKQQELDEINEKIEKNLLKLKKGGIKLSEARDLAIDVRVLRMQKHRLLVEVNAYDDYTAESQSDNAKFDYLVSVCIKDEEGNKYFKDVEDYQSSADQPFVIDCARKLASMMYGLDENWEENLPENKFLKQHSFIDDQLRLVNKEGKHVTQDGKLIDENFRYIDEEGNYIDEDGNKVDEDGLPIVESSPFLDDDGNPIQ